jgi:Domain of unknown function (DUF4434)
VKSRQVIRRVPGHHWLLMFAAALLLSNSPAHAACESLQGTFLQLTNAQLARPLGDWQQLIDELRSIGISNLFLQWTVADRKALFQTVHFETVPKTPLPYILNLASQSGMQVWIGLATDSNYWERIKQGPDLLRTYFRNRVRDLSAFLDDLNTAIAGAPFAGWYIADEIDDQTWLGPDKRVILKQYLAETVKLVKSRRPASKVAISGFTNSFADPDLLASFWAEVIESCDIDLLLFQDGVGEGKVAIENISLYYEPLNVAVRRVGARLGAVVELFSLMPNGQRVPAMIGRIREQITEASRLTSFPPVAFSVPDYMSNLAGTQAASLLQSFRSTRMRCRG